MLIIEGPDAVGKTTLAKKLAARLGYVYCHFTRLPDMFDRYWGYVDRMSQRVVQDRFHLSEIVYAKARGDSTTLTPEVYRLVDARLRLLGAFTVLITADLELIESRWEGTQMYNKKLTLNAADSFQEFRKERLERGNLPEYEVDIDWDLHCTKEYPYVDDAAADEIAREYLRRQDTLARVLYRKPLAL